MPQLTSEQQKQNQTVISAGRKAYRMLIPVTGNPHPKPPYHDLWEKGWRIERKKDDAIRKPYDPNRAQFKKPVDPKLRRPHKKYERRQPTEQQQQQPVMSEKLIERFNRRHQTRA